MYAVVGVQSKTITHSDNRMRAGTGRKETMKWYRVIDADTGDELHAAHHSQPQMTEWAEGFNTALKMMGIASPFAGTWEWQSPQGVTHAVEAGGYCLTCGRTHKR